jgi:ABC-type nitrate/sulfonate/bicarbonate transport system substrate-binding protein
MSVGCESGSNPSGATTTPKVTLGIQVSPAMALVMVAKDRGLFKGIEVEIKEFSAGKFAMQAFLSDAIDFAVSGEVPVCLATLQGNETRVVAQVVERTINEVRVVARRDGTLDDPKAYFKAKKRKIATSFGGGPEFYTYNFLKRYEIGKGEVEILSQKPEDMPAALLAGSIDAISVFDPFAFIAEKKMGDKAITFTDPALYSELYVLNAHPKQVVSEPAKIEAIVRGLESAAAFIESDPESSKEIVRRYTKLDRDVIDGIWNNFVFRPTLTPELVEVWKAEAAWARETAKVSRVSDLPDLGKIVDDRFLRRSSQ